MVDRVADGFDRVGRVLVVLVGIVVAVAVSWFVFFDLPGDLADLLGVLLVLATGLAGARIASRFADSAAPERVDPAPGHPTERKQSPVAPHLERRQARAGGP